MIFVTVTLTAIGFAIGYLYGRATQFHNARERMRLRIMSENRNKLTPERIEELLNEL